MECSKCMENSCWDPSVNDCQGSCGAVWYLSTKTEVFDEKRELSTCVADCPDGTVNFNNDRCLPCQLDNCDVCVLAMGKPACDACVTGFAWD